MNIQNSIPLCAMYRCRLCKMYFIVLIGSDVDIFILALMVFFSFELLLYRRRENSGYAHDNNNNNVGHRDNKSLYRGGEAKYFP
jgi:hypothetical protein